MCRGEFFRGDENLGEGEFLGRTG